MGALGTAEVQAERMIRYDRVLHCRLAIGIACSTDLSNGDPPCPPGAPWASKPDEQRHLKQHVEEPTLLIPLRRASAMQTSHALQHCWGPCFVLHASCTVAWWAPVEQLHQVGQTTSEMQEGMGVTTFLRCQWGLLHAKPGLTHASCSPGLTLTWINVRRRLEPSASDAACGCFEQAAKAWRSRLAMA